MVDGKRATNFRRRSIYVDAVCPTVLFVIDVREVLAL